MNNDLDKILKELYQFDPAFKAYEKDLRQIIQKIILAKPKTKFSRRFASQLRAQLLAKAELMKKDKTGWPSLILNLFTMKKLTYATMGVITAIVIIVPVVYTLMQPKKEAAPIILAGLQISKTKDNAFGQLATSDQKNSASATAQPRALGLGGGGGSAVGARMEAGKLIPPDFKFVNFKYAYLGQPVVLDKESLAVLKRVKDESSVGNIASLLKSSNLGLADLSSFSGSRLQNITFNQNKPFGYTINANLEEGTINIFKNYREWPQSKCTDQACYDTWRVKLEDLPSDEEAIKIADDFLASTKISLKNYGQPYVDNNWRFYYEQAADTTDFYFPDTVMVTYPLQINGLGVYDGNGYPIGLNVTIDAKLKKINSLDNLTTQNYLSSNYSAITDASRVMKWVEKGGIFSYSYGTTDDNLEVKVGEPKLGYFKQWLYKNNTNDELLVPALIFPIIEKPDLSSIKNYATPDYNKKNVVVPLISDVLDEFEANEAGGPIRVEPLSAPQAEVKSDSTN